MLVEEVLVEEEGDGCSELLEREVLIELLEIAGYTELEDVWLKLPDDDGCTEYEEILLKEEISLEEEV